MAAALGKIVEQASTADLTASEMAAGRIVAAGIDAFDAECFPQSASPVAGALVRTVDGPVVYAVVTSIETSGLDPSRPLVPHGDAADDLDAVLAANPHLPLLLHTSFHGRIVAFEDGGATHYALPERPPSLWARVKVCDVVELQQFTESMEFLEPLVTAASGEDDVVAAFLRQCSRAHPRSTAFLVDAGRALVPLLSREPDRLTAILRRIRPAST
jgi:hypothetical protein